MNAYEQYKCVLEDFYTDGSYLYKKEEKTGDYVQVGPFIIPFAVLVMQKRGKYKAYLFYLYKGRKLYCTYGDKKRMMDEIQRSTGSIIIEEKDFIRFIGLYEKRIQKFQLQDKPSGSKEKELELMKKVFKDGGYLALGYIFGFATPLVYPLQTGNFVVFLEGGLGICKIFTNYLALSLYGHYEALDFIMNTTSTALEIVLNHWENVYVCFNKASVDIENIVRMIYEPSKFRGIVGINSGESCSSFIKSTAHLAQDMYKKVIVVNFADFDMKVCEALLGEIRNSITENYGWLIVDWLGYVKSNMNGIKESYNLWLATLQDEALGYRFNKQEQFLALLFTTAEHVCKVFGIDPQGKEKVFRYLWKVCDTSDESFRKLVAEQA